MRIAYRGLRRSLIEANSRVFERYQSVAYVLHRGLRRVFIEANSSVFDSYQSVAYEAS
jgi:hypothetical protein